MSDKPFYTHKQKRQMEKAKNTVTITQLIDWIIKYKPVLKRLPKNILSVRKYEKSFGDRWSSESYWGYTLKFKDGTHILVANVQHIEDDDDWGQAESYNSQTCCDKKTFRQIPPKQILVKLKNLLL